MIKKVRLTVMVTEDERSHMLGEMCRRRHYRFSRPCSECDPATWKRLTRELLKVTIP